MHRLPGRGLDEVGRPVHAGEVSFRKRDDWPYRELRKLLAQRVMESTEFFRTAIDIGAIVKHTIRGKELLDRLAAALVPNLVEPSNSQSFVRFQRQLDRSRGHMSHLLRRGP